MSGKSLFRKLFHRDSAAEAPSHKSRDAAGPKVPLVAAPAAEVVAKPAVRAESRPVEPDHHSLTTEASNAAAAPLIPLATSTDGDVQHATSPLHTESPVLNRDDETGAQVAPQPDPSTRDLWREALEKLPKGTQAMLPLGDPGHKPPLQQQIEELCSLVRTKQEDCEKKFWKLRVGDHEIVLRDYAVTIVAVLDKIGDVAIQFAPPQASMPWSVVKALMQIPVKESAQMCALLASVDKIVSIMHRGQVYEVVYFTEDTADAALANLQSALVSLYSAVLELLADSAKLFSKNTAERTVHAILHPGTTEDLFSKLSKLEGELGQEVQACESSRSAAADARLTALLRQLEAPLTRVDEKVSSLLERVGASELFEILNWISPILYGKHHDTVREARTPATCEWLLQSTRFREWEDASSSVIMWLQGSPGAGKTFLTSRVVDHVRSILDASPNHEGFAFFYCNRNESDRRDPLSILRSYVRQLSTVASSREEMRGKLRELYKEMRNTGSELTMEVCKAQLLESVNIYPKTTLVLDALDECELDTRGHLLDVIEFLVQNSERPLKVFISSRPDGDIRDRFHSRPNINIQATDNQDDIAKYVNEEITKHPRWGKISSRLREDMVDTLLSRSQGMFQWAALQIKQLLRLRTEADLKARLGKLPVGLEDAYNEIYANIAAQGEHAKLLADRALMWVMCAFRPLHSVELLDAVRIDPRDDVVQLSDELDEDLLLDICNNLLVLDPQRQVWTFSHLSVTEYFEKNHWTLSQAHCHAAGICLMLLMEMRPSIELTEPEMNDGRLSDDQHNGFSDASHEDSNDALLEGSEDASHDGSDETQHGGPDDAPHDEFEDAIDHGADNDHSEAPDEAIDDTFDYASNDAYEYASHDDHNDGSNGPVDDAFDDGSVDGYNDRFSFHSDGEDQREDEQYDIFHPKHPLQIYSRYHWISHVHALNGSTVDPALMRRLKAFLGSPSESSLHYKAWYLQANADESWMRPPHVGDMELFNIKPETSPILSMCRFGLFSALSDWWADGEIPTSVVNTQKEDLLTIAAMGGSLPILDALLRRGMQINVQPQMPSFYGNPLVAAVAEGNAEVVNFLLDRGADINLQFETGFYGSALEAAVHNKKAEMVKLLVKKGADIDMPLLSGTCGSALAAAVDERGGMEVARILIEHGADVNLPLTTGIYGSALATAVYRWDFDLIEFLLENGADINMPLPSGRVQLLSMAISAAGDEGDYRVYESPGWRTRMLRFLIQKGADVNAPFTAGSLGNALVAAAYKGLKDCVEILIEAGADVNLTVENGVFRTALEAAEAGMSVREGETLKWDDTRVIDLYAWKRDKAEIVELLRSHVSVSSQHE